jgi:hypothetical protein
VVGSSGYRNAPHTHYERWTGVPGRSKLMNPKAIFGWDAKHPAVGGRSHVYHKAGAELDAASKDAKVTKKGDNKVEIVIDNTTAHELMTPKKKGIPRVPSPVLGPSNAQQSPNMPQKGDAVGATN